MISTLETFSDTIDPSYIQPFLDTDIYDNSNVQDVPGSELDLFGKYRRCLIQMLETYQDPTKQTPLSTFILKNTLSNFKDYCKVVSTKPLPLLHGVVFGGSVDMTSVYEKRLLQDKARHIRFKSEGHIDALDPAFQDQLNA